MSAISNAEKDYIRAGCADNIRFDGRDAREFREWSIENNIFPHVHGSGRVRIAEVVDVVCSVKLEVGEPESKYPNRGIIDVSVELSPSSNQNIDDFQLADIASSVTSMMQRVYVKSEALDLKSLVIIPGKLCWVVHIDILVLQSDGNPLDACSVAAYLSLQCCKVPKVDQVIGESGQPEDFEVSGDLADSSRLDVSRVPLIMTAYKIGSSLILDAESVEQSCADCALAIAVDQASNCCGVVKMLDGSITGPQVGSAIEICSTATASIFEKINRYSSEQMSAGLDEGYGGLFPDLTPARQGLLV